MFLHKYSSLEKSRSATSSNKYINLLLFLEYWTRTLCVVNGLCAGFLLNTIFGVKITNGVTHTYTYWPSATKRAYSCSARILSQRQCLCSPKTGVSCLSAPVYRPAYSPFTSTFNWVVASCCSQWAWCACQVASGPQAGPGLATWHFPGLASRTLGDPGRTSSQFVGLAMKIPPEADTSGLVGIEPEHPGTGQAELGQTGICNHMQSNVQICKNYGWNMHKIYSYMPWIWSFENATTKTLNPKT